MATFVFSVDSALLSELGEKLVSSVHVALTELVKNAYDADATSVQITIKENAEGLPEITVKDNGSGMTLEEVRSYWMKIGTSNKVDNPHSKRFGRPRTGAKGIGRFCCRRLGTHLKLETCAKLPGGHYEETEIFFNWEAFTPGTDVGKITCEGSSQKSAA
ncbi:MAG TPA: ATP-binding protein, partial [Verrucomicrobiae bacterium]|nr:ATP-binding protein [Verrucomicrobiae bacterium]